MMIWRLGGIVCVLLTFGATHVSATDLLIRTHTGYTQTVTQQDPFPARTQPGGTFGGSLALAYPRYEWQIGWAWHLVGRSSLDGGFAYRAYRGSRTRVSVFRRLQPNQPDRLPVSLAAGAAATLSVWRFRDSTLYAAAPGATLLARIQLDRPATPWVWYVAAGAGADWRRDVEVSAYGSLEIGAGFNVSRRLRPWIRSLEPPNRPVRPERGSR